MKVYTNNFNPQQIINSGQCFRMEELDKDIYYTITKNKHLIFHKIEDDIWEFSCSQDEYDLWHQYFDFDRDYQSIINSIDKNDIYLSESIKNNQGLRILQQDPFEMIITFIISQQNNIPRIKNLVNKLCQEYGEYIGHTTYKSFPSAKTLSQVGLSDLHKLGLGYRDKYIKSVSQSVVNNTLNIQELQIMGYDNAFTKLKQEYGIGDKVANCICLFGLGYVNAFPIDTHMKYILDTYYPNGFPHDRYDGYLGIIQQYLFSNKINNK